MAAPLGTGRKWEHWPGWRAMTGDREVGEWQGEGGLSQGPASTVVQAPARVCASISCSGIFPRGGGAFLRRGRSPSGSREVSQNCLHLSQNCLPRPIPKPQPSTHPNFRTAGSGEEVSSLSFWGCK